MPPISTYRLQLHAEFDFAAAAAIVPYLAALGVSHVYCSPVLQAAPGSVHGYDVVDHSVLSEDLGGDAGWTGLVAACREHGLGLVVDVVPNHMAMPEPERLNPALWQALAGGRATPTARWLDVDWEAGAGRIMLPVLGRPLDAAIAAGELSVDGAAGVVRYFDHVFPLASGSLDGLAETDVAEVLTRQHYRLAFWREANTSLNYRRFFDVTTLLGVRVELPEVFRATHARLLELVADGEVDGLRIDHPDGLADPGGYLRRLADATGGTWTVAEKILEPGEELPVGWPCAGTTGYDALGAVTNVFVDPAGRDPLDRLWRRLAPPELAEWEAVTEAAKRLVVTGTFEAEVQRLLRCAGDAAAHVAGFVDAVRELLVAFPVYRAYPGHLQPLDAAARLAGVRRPDLADAIERVRALAAGEHTEPTSREFATRFAQTTGPVMAKGVEDTALYRYSRLTALNEVGGDPGVFGRPVEDFHAYCSRTVADWPHTMTTLSTHDTKRSEDVRARLAVLAEIPDVWGAAVAGWEAVANRPGWPELDRPTRYLAWQTLVGAWPLPTGRLAAYLAKATREAKLHTSWTDPHEEYDAAVRAFAQRVTTDAEITAAIADFVARQVLHPGRSNSLAQKLVQLTMPGVPDVYQGSELSDLSLVDPDNRRAVDYDRRRALLAAAGDRPSWPDPGADETGVLKLAVTAAALRLRRERPATFLDGGYEPVTAHGPAAGHLLGFRRGDDVVAVVTRLPVGLQRIGGWHDTAVVLPAGEWHDAITGRPADTERIGDLFAALPLALLVRERG